MGFGYTERGFVMPRQKTVTASGNPLNLYSAKRLRQLTIYGNAVQDGTPTPDTPVDIQLCGDRTGNLFDKSNVVLGWRLNIYGSNINTDLHTDKFISDYIPVEPNAQYYYNYTTNWDTRLCEYDADKTFLISHDAERNPFSGVFTTKSETAYIRFTNYQSQLDYAIFAKSSETVAYEPYGYKVSGRVESVNLLDVGGETSTSAAGVTWIINNDGSVTVNGTPTDYSGVSFPRMKAKPNTIYTLSTNIEIPNVVGVINFYDADNTMVATNTGTNSSSMLQAVSPEGTTNVTVGFKRNINNVAIPETTFYPMLLKGSYTADTIPPYEPYQPPQDFAVYLPQQIAKVGDVADTVVLDMEKRTAELVQRVRRYDFTGDETWIVEFNPDYPGGQRYWSLVGLGLENKRYLTPSNRFRTTDTMQNYINSLFAYGGSFYLYVPDYQNTADIQEFFSTNPTYAYLPYATPVTTDITAMQDWDAMPQVKGTVTLTLSAEVPPSGAEAVYISSRSPKPKAQTIADVVINEADPEHTEASEPEQTDKAAALNIEMITYE